MSSRIEQIIQEIEEYVDSCKFQPLSTTKTVSYTHLDVYKRQTYKSLDTSIVSVDSKGNLNFKKAKKLGKVTIQITAAKSSSYAPATRKLTITTVKGTPSVSCVQQQERKIYDGAFNLRAKAAVSYTHL